MASTSTPSGKTVRTGQNLDLNASEIELMKTEFNEKLHEHFLSTRNSKVKSLFSQNCLNLIINTMKKEEEKSRLDSSYINSYQNDLVVETSDGKLRLLKKDNNGKHKVFLPWEDMFDIFFESHLKHGHPKVETLKNILQADYIVNDFALQNISKVCYICSMAHIPYFRCSLDIVAMSSNPNFAFASIMAYQDMFTGFIHLRPLGVDNKESEICMELLKIFMDFGPPREILYSAEVFKIALDQIKHLTAFTPIPIKITKVLPSKQKIQDIRKNITNWMTNHDLENWSIGCYGAQLYLNKSVNGPRQKSPYVNVFKELKSFVIKGIKRQEELDRSELSSSKNVRIEKKVSTGSPIDSNATRHCSVTTSVEPVTVDTSSSEQEGLDTNEADVPMTTEYTISSSDDDLAEFEEKDPLDLQEIL